MELTNSAIGEIQIRGSLRVTVESACDRCLETASFPIQKEFALSYYPVEQFQGGGEDEIDEEESEIAYYDGGGLQLQDILREVVLLSAPMQFICSESCKGICPNCGQNRNQQDCQCQVQPVDDRWTQLKAIRIAPAPQ